MKREDAQEYTESLGQIVAGSWRQIAWATKQGIPKALGMSTEQWVSECLGGYVRLSISDRREAVAELSADGMSQREIASVLGVGKGTIDRDLAPNGAVSPTDQGLPGVTAPHGAPATPRPSRLPSLIVGASSNMRAILPLIESIDDHEEMETLRLNLTAMRDMIDFALIQIGALT
jgi:hypothetical protein